MQNKLKYIEGLNVALKGLRGKFWDKVADEEKLFF
jgi:hypothetical protein